MKKEKQYQKGLEKEDIEKLFQIVKRELEYKGSSNNKRNNAR
jgi:hypothetical protein